MISAPIAPSSGDKISATWMRALVNYVRAIRPIAGPGIRTLETPNGTILSARNERDRRAPAVSPWSFSCVIDPETDERTGGWTNCRMQIGMAIDWHSPDLSHAPSDTYHVIGGTDLCDDGDHYLEITLANGAYDPEAGIDRLHDAAEIKIASPGESVPASDYVGGIIRITLGTVTDGKIGYTPHFNPIVYKYV